MVFDQEHIEIFNRISTKLDIPVKEVIAIVKDFTNYNREQLSNAVHNKSLEDNYRLTIPNCFSFYSMKGRIRINRERRFNKEQNSISNEEGIVQ